MEDSYVPLRWLDDVNDLFGLDLCKFHIWAGGLDLPLACGYAYTLEDGRRDKLACRERE